MADLQELFARLNGGAASNQHAQHGYQQPSVSSPIASPSPSGPQPHHRSAVISPNLSVANTPVPTSEVGAAGQQTPQQQSAQLLNLLRFNSQPGIGSTRRVSQNLLPSDLSPAHSRTVSASDLVATVMGSRAPPPGLGHGAFAAASPVSTAAENPQDLLLRLLNHPKPGQPDGRSSRVSSAAFSPPAASYTPEMALDAAHDFPETLLENLDASVVGASSLVGAGSGISRPASQLQAETVAQPPKFTYINPFDQLEAASPRNRTPNPEGAKPSVPGPKIEILKAQHAQEVSTTKATPTQGHETVAEAVSDLGEQVDQQIREALAKSEENTVAHAPKDLDEPPAEIAAELEKAVTEVATTVKDELADEEKAKELEETLPKPFLVALKEVATEVVEADVADNWETAEAEESAAQGEEQTVIVYRFPMRAFASIMVNQISSPTLQFKTELFMDIARLKKDFDQIDRSLVSASKNFIVYALIKKGGFRIIRQDTGKYRQVFESHPERIFNIALCTSGDDTSKSVESILGIGINGTVFWTSLDPAREDTFGESLDTRGFMLPPSPLQDDNTSGGQLKTRAKPSSRHPEFFAVGRGKSIHIIFPKVAAKYVSAKSRICQTETYFKERSLKIVTGKAGKDFAFSEDDTIIVSLDKAGRMRFWDIRTLIEPELGIPGNPPRQVEVSDTLLEFHTTTPNAKSWPTSVFFFDKDKPFTKGIALRYVMVGMKQNHSFQLWDLGLGKAVQEIHLPHENESDAICSVAFHPRTGIMAVAHPTRNSIFFVHVSCPRYNLPPLSQAAFISRLANKSDKVQPSLPPVNATAIMTGIAEYSFESKGQIRSLHMLNDPAQLTETGDSEDVTLFEMYIMHSKGVCLVRIRRSDLGWKKEGEPMNPKDAEAEGVITITQLKAPQPVTDESSTAGESTVQKAVSERSTRESVKKESSHVSKQTMTPEAAMRASTLAKVESKQDAARAAIINGGADKSDKRKKKRSPETASQVSTASRLPPPSYAQAAQRAPSPQPPAAAEPIAEQAAQKLSDSEVPAWAKKLVDQYFQQTAAPTASTPGPVVAFDDKKIEQVVQAEITKGFSRELDVMYKRFDEDKRILNAANGAKQEAILRLVSSTLTENVEGVISKMVDESIKNVVLPEVLAKTSATLDRSINSHLKATLGPHLSKEIPDAVVRALKLPQVSQSFSDHLTKKLTGTLGDILNASIGGIINPSISQLSGAIEQQLGDQLRLSQEHRREDAAKITQLTSTVHTCLETIQAMSATQVELQSQVLALQQSLLQLGSAPAPSSPPSQQAPPPPKTEEELEAEAIANLMSEGKYEQATMQWLQSGETVRVQLFNSIFARYDPTYLRQVSPLITLSAAAVVSEVWEDNLPQRLLWLDVILSSVDPNDTEIRDLVPRIIEVVRNRLTAAYISLNESTQGSPYLRRISTLINRCTNLAPTVGPFSPRG